ncbi:metal ABC transporter substrate-binding protein [Halocatena halophila]|uniref:metal ABC transporter substrate-binding protein n=1 Tax=Halocatena halophila TaxID=2814576 RepID=UPI002ED069EB
MDDVSQINRSSVTLTRRKALAAGCVSVTAGLTGCLSGTFGGTSTDDSGLVAVASFFSFYDFARKIVRETPISVRNLIPTGLHGHGWEPNAKITQDIIEADAFIHVGKDFQPWADRAIQTVKDDGVDTQLINVRDGIELVDLAASLDRDEEGVGNNRAKDPHFWLDPLRAKQAVDNITQGLTELAPAHEQTITENATQYKSGILDRIHADYQTVFDDPPRRVTQLAAHNAFQYLGVRYDIEMRPLVVNLAASGDVKPSDITEAKRVIETNDIRYIAAAVFETRKPAEQLLAETPVEAYFPVTPYAGVRKEWVEQGWGYEEIAYNINIPTFNVVLGNKTPPAAGPDGWADQWRNYE